VIVCHLSNINGNESWWRVLLQALRDQHEQYRGQVIVKDPGTLKKGDIIDLPMDLNPHSSPYDNVVRALNGVEILQTRRAKKSGPADHGGIG